MFEPVEQRRVFESEVVVYCDLVDAGLVQYADVVEVYIILTCEFDLEAYRGLKQAGHEHVVEGSDFVVYLEHLLYLVELHRLI